MLIEAQSISVDYGPVRVMDQVSVVIRTGELVGFIGPNGAGKSTLIRALAGLQPLSSGELLFNDKAAMAVPRTERARHVAYLAQQQNADWPLRAYDVVMLGRLPHRASFGSETAADREAVARALQAVGMNGFRDRVLGQLSGGERARILLARALAVEAPILFADEPVAALDPLHQLKTMDLLRSRVNAGQGVVAVLHDLTLALRYCDRIVLLDQGKIRIDGPPDLLTDDVLAEVYSVDVIRGSYDGCAYVVPWQTRQNT